ncbi:MAG: shikimate kinase [Christensenellales bacterium]
MAFGLIGEHLDHSFSPQIHALLGTYAYQLIALSPAELPGFMQGTALEGFNVTIPYKQAVIPYLSALSPAARAIGSVNTVIRRPDGSLYGDNTDAYGFLRLLGDAGALRGRKALILGSGGASRTVQWVLREAGLAPVIVISRRGESHYGTLDRHRDAALLVNTTPVGMYPRVQDSPLSLAGFDSLRLVIDLIYNPARTRLLLEAERLGIPCRGGLLMLAAQAQRASELFHQRQPGEDISETITEALRRRTLNLALIGMPGCGKTSIGRELAKLSGRPFLDTDEIAAVQAGMSPAAYIRANGEGAFRALETSVLAQACRESGGIIATGGGVVTQPGNLDLLRQNSRIVLLERPLHRLPVGDRPLSQAEGPAALYEKRQPLYLAWSEKRYHVEDIPSTALAIKEEML